jgi:hypothetical protein
MRSSGFLNRCMTLMQSYRTLSLSATQRHILYIGLMWVLITAYVWPVAFANGSIVPYDVLYSMEPWHSELGDVAAAHEITDIWNIESIDTVYGSLPMAQVIQRQLRSGQLPVWDHNSLTGFPLGAFYPVYPVQMATYWLLPPDQAISKLMLFHVLLLSLFTYLLVVSLEAHPLSGVVAGLVATINGIVVYYLIAPVSLVAIAWIVSPFWCFVRFRKELRWRWSIIAGLCYGLFNLTANTPLVLYTSIAYGIYVLYYAGAALWRRDVGRATRYIVHSGLMVIIGVLIGLPSLLMLYQFTDGVQRAPIVTRFTEFASWIRLLVPNYWGSPLPPPNLAPGFANNTRVYLGVVPLVLALVSVGFARRKAEARVFMLLFISFIAITLDLPPFATVFYALMPKIYLDHSRTLIVATLLAAVAAGLGVDAIMRLRTARVWAAGLLGVLAIGLLGLFLATTMAPAAPPAVAGAPSAGPDAIYRGNEIAKGLGVALAGLALMLVWRGRLAGMSMALLVGVVAVDLFASFWHYQSIYPSGLMQAPPLIQRLADRVHQSGVAPARVYSVDEAIFGPKPMILDYFDIPAITGYTSLPFERYNKYTFGSGARAFPNHTFWLLIMEVTKPHSRMLDALGAEYVLLPRSTVIESDTRTLLLPELPRHALFLPRVVLPGLPDNSASSSQPISIPIQPNGRSYLLTGIAVQAGSVTYEIRVNGAVVASETLSKATTVSFWRALAIDLSRYAGQQAMVELRADSGPGSLWNWVDPQLHYNPDSSLLRLVDAGGMLVYHNLQAFPRAWLVHQAITIAPHDLEAALAEVANPELDLRRLAVVETPRPLSLGAAQPQDSAEIVRYDPTHVVVKVTTGEAGLLVMPDVYHETWRASLDGAPTTMYATNLTMRGVHVPPGTHMVEFYFDLRNFYIALGVALLVAAGCLAWLIVEAVAGFRRQPTTSE